MAIQRIHKKSDLEKRLRLLNQQLYGKQEEKASESKVSPHVSFHLPLSNTKAEQIRSVPFRNSLQKSEGDIKYLRIDLLKITILASFAFVSQFLLYYLIQNKLINLSFLNLNF